MQVSTCMHKSLYMTSSKHFTSAQTRHYRITQNIKVGEYNGLQKTSNLICNILHNCICRCNMCSRCEQYWRIHRKQLPSDEENQENEKQERNQQDSDNYTESPDNDTNENITEVPYDSDYGEGTDEAVNETDLSASEPENETNKTTVPRIMHATGNPILMLVIVAAGLGSAAVLRRK